MKNSKKKKSAPISSFIFHEKNSARTYLLDFTREPSPKANNLLDTVGSSFPRWYWNLKKKTGWSRSIDRDTTYSHRPKRTRCSACLPSIFPSRHAAHTAGRPCTPRRPELRTSTRTCTRMCGRGRATRSAVQLHARPLTFRRREL